MAIVICCRSSAVVLVPSPAAQAILAYTLQHLDLLRHRAHLLVVLALELIVHRIAVPPLPIRRRRPEPWIDLAASPAATRVCAEACAGRRLRVQVTRIVRL